MSKERMVSRLMLLSVLTLVALVSAACYKDAGVNVPPTSRQVNLDEITPTTPAPPPTQEVTLTPDAMAQATPTRRLIPTTTPSDAVQEELPPTLATSEIPAGDLPATPTTVLLIQPSFTPLSVSGTPTEIATKTTIATPGMSDIRPSDTPVPTIDPAMRPTPTSIPVEENPCIHIVNAGDTLFSIARDNEVELEALVAANPSLLGGNPNAILQIGWQLRLPGCGDEEIVAGDEPQETPAGDDLQVAPGTGEATGPIIHVVQPGEGIYAIARKYGLDPQVIIDANNLVNPNVIYPGDELIIPLGE